MYDVAFRCSRRRVTHMKKLKYIPGDLVMVDGFNTIYKITDVESQLHSDDFLYTLDPIGIGAILFDLPVDCFGPIPLTSEILEKNGWKFDGSVWIYEKKYLKDMLILPEDETYVVYTSGVRVLEFHFVHQLQHFLFALGLRSDMEVWH